jgi:hypothetical protein
VGGVTSTMQPDAEGGLLDRTVWTDELIYRQGPRRIVATNWLFRNIWWLCDHQQFSPSRIRISL